jgi:hypothetical protein
MVPATHWTEFTLVITLLTGGCLSTITELIGGSNDGFFPILDAPRPESVLPVILAEIILPLLDDVVLVWQGPLWLWSWSYGSLIYNYICNQCLSPLMLWGRISFRQGVLNTTLCDKVCQWLVAGRWFSPGTPVSSNDGFFPILDAPRPESVLPVILAEIILPLLDDVVLVLLHTYKIV